MCFVHGQGQKIEQKLTTKNFVESHNHFFLLTMNKTAKYLNKAMMTFRGQKELKSLTLFFTKLWGPYSYDKLKLNYFSSKVTHYVLQNFN